MKMEDSDSSSQRKKSKKLPAQQIPEDPPPDLNNEDDGGDDSSGGMLKCAHPGCRFKSRWEFNLIRHRRVHDPNRPKQFHCPVCSKDFDFKCNLLRHLNSLHPNFIYDRDQLKPNSNPAPVSVSIPTTAATPDQLHSVLAEKPVITKVKKRNRKKKIGSSSELIQAQAEPKQQMIKIQHEHQEEEGPEEEEEEGLTSKSSGRFVCPRCKLKFSFRCNLVRHMRIVKCLPAAVEKKLISAEKHNFVVENPGGTVFIGNGGLKRQEPKNCPHCEFLTYSRTGFYQHLRIHHHPHGVGSSSGQYQQQREHREPQPNHFQLERRNPEQLGSFVAEQEDRIENVTAVESGCVFCKYLEKLGRYLRKHLEKCPGCHRPLLSYSSSSSSPSSLPSSSLKVFNNNTSFNFNNGPASSSSSSSLLLPPILNNNCNNANYYNFSMTNVVNNAEFSIVSPQGALEV